MRDCQWASQPPSEQVAVATRRIIYQRLANGLRWGEVMEGGGSATGKMLEKWWLLWVICIKTTKPLDRGEERASYEFRSWETLSIQEAVGQEIGWGGGRWGEVDYLSLTVEMLHWTEQTKIISLAGGGEQEKIEEKKHI